MYANLPLPEEVKRQLDYADAVRQLGIRQATVGWYVQVCCNVRNQDMRLVGRLIVSKSIWEQVLWSPFGPAAREWNYSLYVHGFLHTGGKQPASKQG